MKNSISKLNLTDNYRVLHPTTEKYTLFSNINGTFTKILNIRLRDFQKMGSKQFTLLDYKIYNLVNNQLPKHCIFLKNNPANIWKI